MAEQKKYSYSSNTEAKPASPSQPKLSPASPELTKDPVDLSIELINKSISLLDSVTGDNVVLAIGKLKGALEKLGQ